MVRAELLSAKGQMYDELRAKVDRLQEENQRLQVGRRPRGQLTSAAEAMHCVNKPLNYNLARLLIRSLRPATSGWRSRATSCSCLPSKRSTPMRCW